MEATGTDPVGAAPGEGDIPAIQFVGADAVPSFILEATVMVGTHTYMPSVTPLAAQVYTVGAMPAAGAQAATSFTRGLTILGMAMVGGATDH